MGKRYYVTVLISSVLLWSSQLFFAGGLSNALDWLGSGKQQAGKREFLQPDEAFVFTADTNDDGEVRLDWRIAPGYYLYRDKMKFEAISEGLKLGEVALPAGEVKDDLAFGRVEIFRNDGSVDVPIDAAPVGANPAWMRVAYQGCAEDGICYPPIKKEIPLYLDILSSARAAPAEAAEPSAQDDSPVPLAESDRIAARLATQSFGAVIVSFYVFGLLLSFTPCVFPMIPILSGIIVGQGESITVKRATALSLVYVAAMAAAYAVAGVAAGMFGRNLQALFQEPVVLAGFSMLFVLLALSMFGFYEFQIPSGLQTRLDGLSRSRATGTYTGVAMMGLLSALIVGPCVAPPLAGALFYIGHQGSAVIGGSALFAMGLGMGTPLIVLGVSAGKLLPKAGAWMDSVKRVFGVILLGVAIWFLQRVLPGPVTISLWAVLLLATAVFMGALDRLDEAASGWRRLRKGLGLAVLCYGVVLVVGASVGADDPLRPLEPFTGKPAGDRSEQQFTEIKGVAGLNLALKQAGSLHRPAMLDFYADWCIECKRLDRHTFSAEVVQLELAQWELLRTDVTANDKRDRALLASFELYGPPAMLFFDADGIERRDHRLLGYVGPEEFASQLRAIRQQQ